jgi:protein tyrosine phosphatase type 4A
MAGPFSTVAQKRAHEMASNRAASFDMSKTAPSSANHTPIHNSSDAISMTQTVSIVNSGRSTKNGSPTNYFRPAHSQINFGKLNFLITHSPSENSLESYIQDLERYHVSCLVRVCDPTYSAEMIKERGIRVYDWKFDDGGWPPMEIIEKFLKLCVDVFTSGNNNDAIGIHCVAGLGRSPVLIAIALLEAGMKCEDAVFLIRR